MSDKQRGRDDANSGFYNPPSDWDARQAYDAGRAEVAERKQSEAYFKTVVDAASSFSRSPSSSSSEGSGDGAVVRDAHSSWEAPSGRAETGARSTSAGFDGFGALGALWLCVYFGLPAFIATGALSQLVEPLHWGWWGFAVYMGGGLMVLILLPNLYIRSGGFRMFFSLAWPLWAPAGWTVAIIAGSATLEPSILPCSIFTGVSIVASLLTWRVVAKG